MSDSLLEEVWVNFSSRKVTLVSDVGEQKEVQWKWDDEGREGFIETIQLIQKLIEPERLTYCFTTHD